jgi:hypothetical protein
MAYKLLNTIFYPDITNIILEYIMISKCHVDCVRYANNAYFKDAWFLAFNRRIVMPHPYFSILERIKRYNIIYETNLKEWTRRIREHNYYNKYCYDYFYYK